jgi:glycosyltransferase involved in cell wall biosynthesis
MKVALVHDWLTGMRGGERCLEVFCELFPEADLYTLLHLRGSVSQTIERMSIRTSFVQRLPFAKTAYRKYLPLFPVAVESFNLKGYDLILSCSHCAAKGIIPPPGSRHIAYLLTPMRYAWDMFPEYFGERKGVLIPLFMHYLRMWDVTSSQRVDRFLCISKHVQNRIRQYYRREAEILPPPVDTHRFSLGPEKEDFFLVVSSLVPYKRIDLAVQVFNKLGSRLKVIGTGPEERRLRSLARPNVEFLGWQPDAVVADHYSRCRALIFPGEEDFGIVPLEAMACGRPVIAYGRGGALETIVSLDEQGASCPTGLFFKDQTVSSLIEAVERFRGIESAFDPVGIRNHVLQWDRESFKERIRSALQQEAALEKRGRTPKQ